MYSRYILPYLYCVAVAQFPLGSLSESPAITVIPFFLAIDSESWGVPKWHKMMLYFIKCSFYNYWINYMILSFIFLMEGVVFNHLCMLNHSCIPGINPTCLVIVYDLLKCCWIYFTNISFRIFASLFIRDIGLQFFL